jgi:hypothetical protein
VRVVFDPTEISGRGVQAWGRSIASLYIAWYTTFVVANIIALAWIAATDKLERVALRSLGMLCVMLSLLTLGSTAMVGYTLNAVAPRPFGTLIVFAAIANSLGLVAVIWAWRKTLG